MDRGELDFNAWILLGNVLNLLLRGQATPPLDDASRGRLAALDAQLAHVTPERMVSAWRDLAAEDRSRLATVCQKTLAAVGQGSATLLGLEADVALATLRALQTEEV